jgi:hypothetical protein
MKLLVKRRWLSTKSTEGELFVDGAHEAFTLEPPVRSDSVKPRAIPDGTYEVKIAFSPKHNRFLPHVTGVPGFDDIEIHIGNFPADTLGCLLVGQTRGVDAVYNSKAEFDLLYPRIQDALAESPVFISYVTELAMAKAAQISPTEGR